MPRIPKTPINRRLGIVAIMAMVAALAGGAVSTAAPADVQRVHVGWHMQSGNVPFSPVGESARAQLVRTENGISYSLRTERLQPGHAYTLWVVVINNPDACTASPCTPVNILQNPATNSQVIYGGGHVVGGEGHGGFAGHLSTGPLPAGWLPDRGLVNPMGADVHLILNDHGPMLTEFMPEMIHTYRAGCREDSIPPIFPATARADGTPGPNTCRLWQVSVFEK
jgi:hypothetical protein